MFHHIRSRQLITLLGVLWVCPLIAFGADPVPGDDAFVLTPDDPGDHAVIDGPWERPFTIRVVTVTDHDSAGSLDPSSANRLAVDVVHPDTGDVIHVNFVEVAEIQHDAGLRVWTEWLVNTELPFTADAQAQSEAGGFDIRQPQHLANLATGEPACWVTGEPVLEIPVWFDPLRTDPSIYHVMVVSDVYDQESITPKSGPIGGDGDGGDPGGNPDGPDRKGDDENVENFGEGGDPGGNPDGPDIIDD